MFSGDITFGLDQLSSWRLLYSFANAMLFVGEPAAGILHVEE